MEESDNRELLYWMCACRDIDGTIFAQERHTQTTVPLLLIAPSSVMQGSNDQESPNGMQQVEEDKIVELKGNGYLSSFVRRVWQNRTV